MILNIYITVRLKIDMSVTFNIFMSVILNIYITVRLKIDMSVTFNIYMSVRLNIITHECYVEHMHEFDAEYTRV